MVAAVAIAIAIAIAVAFPIAIVLLLVAEAITVDVLPLKRLKQTHIFTCVCGSQSLGSL